MLDPLIVSRAVHFASSLVVGGTAIFSAFIVQSDRAESSLKRRPEQLMDPSSATLSADCQLASWPMPIVDTMIVDGNMASVQFHSEGGKGHNGADFNMQYCWVIRLDRERIAEIWGYYDSGKMVALFDDA